MHKQNDKSHLNELIKSNEQNRKQLEKLSDKIADLESEVADLKIAKEQSARFNVN